MKRTGGVGTTTRDHEQNVYVHPIHAREIIAALEGHIEQAYKIPSDDGRPVQILDSCAGEGVLGAGIAVAVAVHGHSPHVTFVEPRAHALEACRDRVPESMYTGFQGDILNFSGRPGGYDVIVCNPPWALATAEPVYKHLVSLLSPTGVLIFLINNVFCYQGPSRAATLLYQKYYFLPRHVFQHAGRPLLDCGIMVYHADGFVPPRAASQRPYIDLSRLPSPKLPSKGKRDTLTSAKETIE